MFAKIKGLVALCHSFFKYLLFIPSTFTIRRGLFSCILVASSLAWGAEPRIELGLALQHACNALPTVLRRPLLLSYAHPSIELRRTLMCGEAQLEGCGDVRENFLKIFEKFSHICMFLQAIFAKISKRTFSFQRHRVVYPKSQAYRIQKKEIPPAPKCYNMYRGPI